MSHIYFKGKNLVINHHLGVPYHQLEAVRGKSVLAKGENVSLSDNLIVHGDNLLALKALLPTHAGKVNCVYIDPPYNTGNEGWCYNDNVANPMTKEWLGKVVDREDLTRHDKWLCMMYPRLKLLHELLAEDGVIFVSIDDNEQHRLRMLMDEIFGEDNFIANLHVEMSTTQGMKVAAAQKGDIAKNAEMILCYCKNRDFFKPVKLLYVSKQWDTHYSIFYDQDTGKSMSLRKFLKSDDKFKNLCEQNQVDKIDMEKLYEEKWFRSYIHSMADKIWRDAMCDIKVNLNGKQKKQLENGKFIEYQAGNRPYILKMTQTGVIRQLLSLSMSIGETDDFSAAYGARKIRGDWWGEYYKDMMNINREGDIEFKNGKKPVRLIRDLLKISTQSNDIILDSFAGSGTTAHAVMRINKEDGGNRKFILVECEEYADKVTAERVRHVIKGVKDAKDEDLKKGFRGGFSYWKLGKAIEMESILKGGTLPKYEELAKYVFFTATGEEWIPPPPQKSRSAKMEKGKYYIGDSRLYEVYLYYEPKVDYLEKTAFTLDMAESLPPAKKGKTRMVFAPVRYVNLDELNARRITYCQLPFEIYRMTKKRSTTKGK